ncbi:uncharacterized protein LOC131225332 isoform X2 [Magnolia sinica]|uniref:uncharacterized protein LOC131225332 isoform X2 n=1 Tax=Magnolia sinica TaxID=86752 RepID=UPI00265A10D2|nr:uncharacterized protein LOC131225332 isoform X2 [Magnolia sinica]
MAIGKSSEGTDDEFVLRSGARSRLKREFAFAVRAQAEFADLTGRTRSMKVYSNLSRDRVSTVSGNKKLKTSDAAEASKIDSGENQPRNGSGLDNAIVVEDIGGIGLNGENGVSTDLGSKKLRTSNAAEDRNIDLNEIQVDDGSGVEDTNGFGSNCEEQNGSMEENTTAPTSPPPTKRFTRSALKGNPDLMEISTEVAAASGRPVKSSDAMLLDLNTCKNEASETDGKKVANAVQRSKSNDGSEMDDKKVVNAVHRSKSAPKKMELKMSKKIASTKSPSNVSELLATGLLEGLPVKYSLGGNKEGLQGTIKDGMILCFCASCKGSKVVPANQFEQHAGSLRKHPSPHIYFENGKTIRDVLNACKTVPLDMLEVTIQSTARTPPVAVKEATTCQKCEEPFHPSRDGPSLLMCNKCLELEQPEASPADEMDDSAGLSEPPLMPKSSKSISKHISSEKKPGQGKLTRKDLRLHKLVFMEDVLPDGTEVAYYVRGQRLLEGYKMGNGIFCSCCNSEVSPSQFEAHAGCASRRKPYLHIYTSNGVSLHELSVSLSKVQKLSASDNDDLCTICADFGDLLLCDGCPRAFHQDCVGLSTVPHGDWYCSYCKTMFEREKFAERNANALAAGRVLGVDPIEQISKRCIRIVKTSQADVTVCVLCRCHDFSKAKFGPRTVLLCDQCEKEYHVGCLKEHKMADLKDLPKGKWFCCEDCSRIHAALEKLVRRGSEKLPDSLLDVIKRKHEEKDLNSADLDVQWRVLSGKITSPDSRLLLSKAVAIFHDCFDPIVDSALGRDRDLIPAMVYGRNVRDQEFGGIYCAILTVNSSIVSAGILRIFGKEVAELPLVATSKENQGQGYFQSLFSCIERLLGFLEVKNLLLPAADEAGTIWTKRFGFEKISPDELSQYTKDSRMMIFEGTSMLHKQVPKCRIVGKPTVSS